MLLLFFCTDLGQISKIFGIALQVFEHAYHPF